MVGRFPPAGQVRPITVFRRIPFRLIGLVLLCYILYTLDVGEVIGRLQQIGVVSLVVAALAFAALLAFRCWRWHVLVTAIGAAMPLRWNVLSYNGSVWVGMATPARLGEFRRATDLANKGALGLGQASALVLFDLSLDLFVFVVLSAAGCLYLFAGPGTDVAWVLFGMTLGIGFAVLLFVRWPIILSIRCVPLIRKIPGVGDLIPILGEGLRGQTATKTAFLTIGVAATYIWMMLTLIGSIVPDLRIVEAMTVVGLAGIAGAIPITYFGLGTRDVALIWYFGLLGQTMETAVAVSLMFLLAQLIGIAVSLGASGILPLVLPKEETHAKSMD